MARKNDYKITIYLGKEMYDSLVEMSQLLSIPLATMTRMLLKTGFEFSRMIESSMKGVKDNGKQQPEV